MTIEELNDILMARGYRGGKNWGLDKTLDGECFPPVVLFYPIGSHCVNMVVDEDSASDDFEWVYRMPKSMEIADWLLSLHSRFYAYSKYETGEDDGVARKVLDELTGIIVDLMSRNGKPSGDTLLAVLDGRSYDEEKFCTCKWFDGKLSLSFYSCDTGRMMLSIWAADMAANDWDFPQCGDMSVCQWLLETYDILMLHSKSDFFSFKGLDTAIGELRGIIIDIMEDKGND